MSTDQAKSQLPPLRYSMARERRFESSSRKSRPSGAHRIISIQKNKDHNDVLSNLYKFFVLIHCLKVTHKNLSRDPVKHATAPAPVDSLHHGWDADNLSRYSRPIWSSQDNTSQKQRIFSGLSKPFQFQWGHIIITFGYHFSSQEGLSQFPVEHAAPPLVLYVD